MTEQRKPHTGELEDLVRWFTRRMTPEDRRALMGDLPVHYKLLYPTVSADVIIGNVSARLAFIADKSRDPLPSARALDNLT